MQSHQFRVGNRVAIVAGAWAGGSGTIVSIMPDRNGVRDDSIKVNLQPMTPEALALPYELKRIFEEERASREIGNVAD